MEEQTRSADEMVSKVLRDPKRLEALKHNPLPELERLREESVKEVPAIYRSDKQLYRFAISILGLLALITAVGSLVLVLKGKTTPEVLVALGSAAVGGLVGLFAPSPVGK